MKQLCMEGQSFNYHHTVANTDIDLDPKHPDSLSSYHRAVVQEYTQLCSSISAMIITDDVFRGSANSKGQFTACPPCPGLKLKRKLERE